jgi:hypothetical protein
MRNPRCPSVSKNLDERRPGASTRTTGNEPTGREFSTEDDADTPPLNGPPRFGGKILRVHAHPVFESQFQSFFQRARVVDGCLTSLSVVRVGCK